MEFANKFQELSEYAFAGDSVSLITGCMELQEMTEKGFGLPATGNPMFDQAWNNAMVAGQNAWDLCVAGDFDASSPYIVEMGEHIDTATTYIQ